MNPRCGRCKKRKAGTRHVEFDSRKLCPPCRAIVWMDLVNEQAARENDMDW